MTDTVAHISEADHATLVSLLDERRMIEARRLRSKRLPGRSRMTLAENLAKDQKFKDELTEVNRQIDELTKQTGGTL
jgi:hypothetical protein